MREINFAGMPAIDMAVLDVVMIQVFEFEFRECFKRLLGIRR